MIPRITIYRPADTAPRAGWNAYRYEEKTYARASRRRIIGAYLVAFKRCFSIQWSRP